MKKITPIIAIFSLLIVACNNITDMPDTTVPAGYGKVTVVINGDQARTVFPAKVFDKMVYTFTKSGGSGQVVEPTGGSFVLEVGSYSSVKVDAYAGSVEPYTLIASGTSGTFTVSSGGTPTNVNITLSPGTGAGVFGYNVTYPAGATITSFSLKRLDAAAADINISPLTGAVDGENLNLSGTHTGVSAGTYFLTIQLKKDDETGGASEVVYVYAGMESAYTKTFTEANLSSEGVPYTESGGVITFTVTKASQWNAAVAAIKGGGNGNASTPKTYVINIVESFGIDGYTTYMFGSADYIDVTINGNNETINLNAGKQGRLLYFGGSSNNQTVTMENLNLVGHSTNTTSVVDMVNRGTFNMKSGTISGNTGEGNGGGVNVSNSTFNMSDGVISGNTAGTGGGVAYNGGGVFNMTGGTISDNTATSNGGGVYGNSTFNMSAGTISGNTANQGGGGVYLASSSTFNMTGGTISGNTATSNGGGVNCSSSASKFFISNGMVYGSDGTSNANTANSGAALSNSGTAQYGTFTGANGAFEENGNLSTTPDTIRVVNGVLVSGLDDYWEVSDQATWTAAVDAIKAGGSGDASTSKTYVINVVGSFSINGYTNYMFTGASYIDVTINGNNKTINLNSNGSLLYFGTNQTVTISGLTLQGRTNNPNNAVVHISGGTFNMTSGTISGNTGPSNGGGVYVSGGTFNMSGGVISGNTAQSGGGIAGNNFTFNMTGGTISGNTASSPGATGGGIAGSNITFNMSGGTISGNKATGTNASGGGVSISTGTFYISDGIVYGSDGTSNANTATSGAALYNGGTAQYGTFTGANGAFEENGNLSTTNNTIEVDDGVLLQ